MTRLLAPRAPRDLARTIGMGSENTPMAAFGMTGDGG